MSENSDRNDLSEQDIVFVRTALDALKEDLGEMLMDVTARANAQWNIDLINSVKEKINKRELQFSDDECKVMYAAALEMRDLMNKVLDAPSSTEYDREMARATLRSSNGLMRMLRKTFIANGIDIDDLA